MTNTAWAEVKRVFGDALDLPTEDRERFVQGHTQDPCVRADVLRLLRRHARLTRFLVLPSPSALHSATAEPSEPAAPVLAAGALLAGRYELGARLGAGAFGTVHRATDRLTRRDVAVKILSLVDARDFHAMRRELAILRRARLPGVVELLDDGVEHGHAFLVMRLVEGTAFPGCRDAAHGRADWEDLAPRAAALLEAVARLHWLGVLHRDLKPENVLVDAAGQVTIVDLGVARDVDGAGDAAYLVGTPAYLAPERMRGRAATVASDLYAVGAMLYEALAGRPPHDFVTLDDVLAAGPAAAPSLRGFAPAVPDHVAAAIDALLSDDPTLRPPSAGAVAALLGGGALPAERIRLPFLGDDAAVLAVVEAAETGRSIDLAGPPGCGRSRALDEAERRLRDAGHRVVRTVPGAGPFDSLVPLVGAPPSARTLEELREELRRTIATWLDATVAIFADDWSRIDTASREVLEALRGRGAIVRVLDGTHEGALVPGPRSELELRALFRGPDRILHLREDGARELWQRTLGSPGAIVREIDLWTLHGIARVERGLVEIDRTGVERLQTRLGFALPPAGVQSAELPGLCRDVQAVLEIAACAVPVTCVAGILQRAAWQVEAEFETLSARGLGRRDEEGRLAAVLMTDSASAWTGARRVSAHVAIAESLPRADLRRLVHLEAAGEGERFAVEACDAARRLLLEGRTVAAFGLAGDAATTIRLGGSTVEGLALDALDLVVESALALANERSLEIAGYCAGLAGLSDTRVRPHEMLCKAAILTIRGESSRALELLAAPIARDRDVLERLRHIVRMLAARQISATCERAALVDVARWARRDRSREARTFFRVSLAWLLYRSGHFAQAARRHARAASGTTSQGSRVLAMLNAASAAMEAGLLDEAGKHARIARERSRALRIPVSEARAAWLERCVAYRAGVATEPDVDLVEAVAALNSPQIEQLVALNEAAIAWRRGALELAHGLAVRARTRHGGSGRPSVLLLADALLWACGDGAARVDRTGFAARVNACDLPGVVLQVVGLAAPAIGSEAAESIWRTQRPKFDAVGAARPREILSIDEVGARLARFLGKDMGP